MSIQFISIIIGWFVCGLIATIIGAIGFILNNKFAPGEMEKEYNLQPFSLQVPWNTACIVTLIGLFFFGPIGLLLILTKGELLK